MENELNENQQVRKLSAIHTLVEKVSISDSLQLKQAEAETFFIIENIDLEHLANIFNTFSTKKTYATGFFNLALIATNISQIKKLFLAQKDSNYQNLNDYKVSWQVIDILLIVFVSISLVLQVLVGVLLVFLARRHHGEFLNDEKREDLIKNNNSVTCLVLAISIINVFINIFMNV